MQIYSKKTEISKKLRENLREIIYNIPTYVASRHTTISYQRCYYKAPQHYYHEHHHNNLITNRPVLVILTYSPTITLQFSCTIISPLTQIRTGKPITEHDFLRVASLPVSPWGEMPPWVGGYHNQTETPFGRLSMRTRFYTDASVLSICYGLRPIYQYWNSCKIL